MKSYLRILQRKEGVTMDNRRAYLSYRSYLMRTVALFTFQWLLLATAFGQVPVAWVNTTNVVVEGDNTLRKNFSSGWNAETSTANIIPAGAAGWIETVITEANKSRMLGLSDGDAGIDYFAIDYNIYFKNNGVGYVYENGLNRHTLGAYTTGDVFRIERLGTEIRYIKNGATLYTSLVSSTQALVGNASMFHEGGTLGQVTMSHSVISSGSPNLGSSQLAVASLSDSKVILTWKKGNGQRRVVLGRKGAQPELPTTGYTFYAASPYFGQGMKIGQDTYVLLDDDQGLEELEITGLLPNRDYQFAVLEYNVLPNKASTFYSTGAVYASHNPPGSPEAGYDVVWTDIIGMTVNGNELTKDGTNTVWGNSGAFSLNKIPASAHGWIEITNTQTNKHRMFGLSSKNIDAAYTGIDYCFYLNGANLGIYERGANIGTFGTVANGDKFRIERVDGVVYYLKNDEIIYISEVTTDRELYFDASFYTAGSILSGAKISSASASLYASQPASAASELSVSAISEHQATLSWTNGNGSDRVIFISASALTPTTDGFDYLADPKFGLGTEMASGQFVLGNFTTENTMIIEGLLPGTQYNVGVVEYNKATGKLNNYKDGAIPAVSFTTSSASGSLESVNWVDLVGVSVNGNSMTKTGASGWNAGAASSQMLESDQNGYVTATSTATTASLMFGLATSNSSNHHNTINHAIYLVNNGQFNVYESGANKGSFGTYQVGDRFKVQRSGGVVYYLKNDQVFYVSTKQAVTSLVADVSFNTTGAALEDVEIYKGLRHNGVVDDQIELQALKDLFTNTDGAGWTNSTGWPDLASWPATADHNDYKDWHGITVENGDITNILLPSNNLNGALSASLGNLSKLENLELYSNNLTGSVPSSLGNLKDLVRLLLYNNNLAGTIPGSLGDLNKLTTLYLYNNNLTGNIPTELGGMQSLKRLYLYSNQLTGAIPTELSNLHHLEYLYLSNNQLTGTIPPGLSQIQPLIYINLTNNQLTGTIPEALAQLSRLQTLFLSTNQLTGEVPGTLGNMPILTSLHLHNNQLTGTIPPELGNLSRLAQLYVSGNQLSGAIPKELGNLKRLTHLMLNDNLLTGSIPPELGQLATLNYFYLYNNQFSGSIPRELDNMPVLTNFNVSNNQLSGTLPTNFGSSMVKLQTFNVNNNNLSGAVPEGLLSMPVLRFVYVHKNDFTSIPDFQNHPNKAALYLYLSDLMLPFDEIEKAYLGGNHGHVTVQYVPQRTNVNIIRKVVNENMVLVNDRTGGQDAQYQWQELINGTWTDISGATNANYTLTGVTEAMIGDQYRCEITNTQITNVTLYSSTYEITDLEDPVDPTFEPKALYNGNITSMHWRTAAPVDTDAQDFEGVYLFDYDDKYQLKEAVFGENNAGAVTISTNNYRLNTLAYDANGNIQTLRRYDHQGTVKHDFSYDYKLGTNQLENIDGHATYHYNDIGQLTEEIGEDVQAKYVDYDVTGKVVAVYADEAKTAPKVTYQYDDRGFRLMSRNEDTGAETWYIRDASGNVMSIYEKKDEVGELVQKEVPVYGSGKIGAYYADQDGSMAYEMTDHLGNVRAVVSRRRVAFEATMEDTGNPDYSNPRVEEMQYFINLDGAEYRNAGFLNHTLDGDISAHLTGNTDKIIGPAITLVAKAGNTYKMEVFGKYEEQASYASPLGVADLASVLGQTYLNTNGQEAIGALTDVFNGALTGFANDGANAALPLAFLNVIHFDAAFNVIQAEKVQLTTAAGFTPGQEHLTEFEKIDQEIEIASGQDGYVYVYVSNHTPGSKVYFDDLLVTLEEDIVTQATDYYPFGSVARRANTPNSYFEDPANTAETSYAVDWTNIIGADVINGDLTQNIVPAGWGNSGASSTNALASGEDGWLSFTANANSSSTIIGLSEVDVDQDVNTVAYGILLRSDGKLNVVESGVGRISGTERPDYFPGDELRIERVGQEIRYYHNGALLYTSAIVNTTNLMVDAAIYYNDGSVTNARVSFGTAAQIAANGGPSLQANTVAGYTFDNTLDDLTGTGGAFTTDKDGNTNSAYLFDGVDDIKTVVNSAGLNITNDLTAMAWIKAGLQSGDMEGGMIIAKHHGGNTNERGWTMASTTVNAAHRNKLQVVISENGTNTTGNLKMYHSSVPVFDDQWHHVAFSFKNGALKLFIDGQEDTGVVKYRDDIIGGIYANSADITIGHHLVDGEIRRYFNGVLDDIYIFNRALIAAEIQQLAQKQTPQEIDAANNDILTDDLIVQYHLNGNLDDNSGNGLNGTNAGATLSADNQGNANSAFSFTGNDAIVLNGTANDFSFVQNTGVFTFSAFVKINDLEARNGIIGNSTTSLDKGFFISYENYNATFGDKQLRFTSMKGVQGQYNLAKGAQNTINDTNWHHIAVVGDGSTIQFYVDGTADGVPTNLSHYATGTSTRDFSLGRAGIGQQHLNGSIDEVHVFNRALTPAEIQQLAQKQTPQEIDAANSQQLAANNSFGQYYRYGFQGEYSEEDSETGWNSFEARMYDPVIGRWRSVDPAGQYWSPYVGM
ncbi:MAG: LamG-like jellyroll fold domain-containing protein, partial [Bacteroidota bacterium]